MSGNDPIDLLIVFSIAFVCVGLPLGALLGSRLARYKLSDDLRAARVEHISELDKEGGPLVMNEFPGFGVFCGLLCLEIKLLLKELFLKAIGKTRRKPGPEQRSENGAPNASKENVIIHGGLS